MTIAQSGPDSSGIRLQGQGELGSTRLCHMRRAWSREAMAKQVMPKGSQAKSKARSNGRPRQWARMARKDPAWARTKVGTVGSQAFSKEDNALQAVAAKDSPPGGAVPTGSAKKAAVPSGSDSDISAQGCPSQAPKACSDRSVRICTGRPRSSAWRRLRWRGEQSTRWGLKVKTSRFTSGHRASPAGHTGRSRCPRGAPLWLAAVGPWRRRSRVVSEPPTPTRPQPPPTSPWRPKRLRCGLPVGPSIAKPTKGSPPRPRQWQRGCVEGPFGRPGPRAGW